MQTALKIASLLLSYPTEALRAEVPAMKCALAHSAVGAAERAGLCALADDLAARDLYDAQERYVLLFDRTRSLCLNLFEHVHGESRDRGQALVDLRAMYEADGLALAVRELPDHLPIFLEYLATRSPAAAVELLAQIAHILNALRERLDRRGSPYAEAFRVLETLAQSAPDAAPVPDLVAEPDDDPADLARLDREWQEAPVTFGAPAREAACDPDRLQRRLRAARRPAPSPNR